MDRTDPHLRLHHVLVYVRDQDRSRDFYVERLGFNLLLDFRFDATAGRAFEDSGRWLALGPPDGNAILGLVTPSPGSEEEGLIGRSTQVVFLTDDVPAKYEEWRRRGVRFRQPPVAPAWGGTFAIFEDLDGNSFGLAGHDEASRDIERTRRSSSPSTTTPPGACAMRAAGTSRPSSFARTAASTASCPRAPLWDCSATGSAQLRSAGSGPGTPSPYTATA